MSNNTNETMFNFYFHSYLHMKEAGVQHPFQFCQTKKVIYVLVIHWQEMLVIVKKRHVIVVC